jgi:hypothetical protein
MGAVRHQINSQGLWLVSDEQIGVKMETRYRPNQPIQLNILDSNELLHGSIVQFRGRVAELKFEQPLPAKTSIRINFEDSILFGEVASLEQSLDGHIATVALQDAIPVMSGLARLIAAVSDAGQSVAPAVQPSIRQVSAG